jgi:4'-phosphopantetheinyl transferase EntD
MPGQTEGGGAGRGAEAVADLLRGWFPAPAAVRVAPLADHPLLAAEEPLVARCVQKRREEIATGRWLVRGILRSWGRPDWPLLTGAWREPLWPAGVQGSISHDGGLCAVVLQRGAAPLGIDLVGLERNAGRLPGLACVFVTGGGELDAVAPLVPQAEPEMLLFSLKEAIVKIVSPRESAFLDLLQIVLEAGTDGALRCSFAGRPLPLRLHAGQAGGCVVTAACWMGPG